jgi:hypothetical protein
MTQDHARQSDRGRVFAGLVIILAGLALLLDRSAIWEVRMSRHYWPLILVALGALRLLDPCCDDGRPRSPRAGAWLLYVGCWGLLNEFHLFGFSYRTSWPLLIVGAGVGMVWRAFDNFPGRSDRVRES